MPDNRFDGSKVSSDWDDVLTHARRMGVDFHLNSGRRTMREQWALFGQNMRRVGVRWVQRPGRPLTAFPSPNAPHIRVGRQAHALDVQTPGETNLQRYLRREGLHPVNDVAGEPWHLTVGERELRAYARRIRGRRRRKR
jgi:hypothetical protein